MTWLTQINRDFVLDEIRQKLPAKQRMANTKFVTFNCPVCVRRGHPRPDRRQRCGLVKNATGFALNCFNCEFKSRFVFGEPLSRNLALFMEELGIDSLTIKRLAYRARQIKEVFTTTAAVVRPSFTPTFAPRPLPTGARSFAAWAEAGESTTEFTDAVAYIAGRGDVVWNAGPYYWTPERKWSLHKRVIVPFLWDGSIVGWTARAIDPSEKHRYLNDSPSNFLFNNRVIAADRKYLVLVEGIFDALAIDGCATEGAHMNEQQAAWLNDSGKRIIVLPDRDMAGQILIDAALKYHWHVSFPRRKPQKTYWQEDIKDAADAVQRYGRFYTLRTILEAATGDNFKIRQWRGKLTE